MAKHMAPETEPADVGINLLGLPDSGQMDDAEQGESDSVEQDQPDGAEQDQPDDAEEGGSESLATWLSWLTHLILAALFVGLSQWDSIGAYNALGLVLAIWLGRGAVHLRQGNLGRRNVDGERVLRPWLQAEFAVAFLGPGLLAANDLFLVNRQLHALILGLTAAAVAIVSGCERIITSDNDLDSGGKWMYGLRLGRIQLGRLIPIFGKVNLGASIAWVLVAGALLTSNPDGVPGALVALGSSINHSASEHHAGGTRQSTQPSAEPDRTPTTAPTDLTPSQPSPTPSPTDTPQPPKTYDQLCVIPGKGVEPGEGAPSWAYGPLYAFVLGSGAGNGLGGNHTGCMQPVVKVSDDSYYQVGRDPDTNELLSVNVVTKGCEPIPFTAESGQAALSLLALGIPICSADLHPVGDGNIEFIGTPLGTYSFVRSTQKTDAGPTAYQVLDPQQTTALARADKDTNRWLWPTPNAGAFVLSDTGGTLHYAIGWTAAGSVSLIEDGKRQRITGSKTGWVRFAPFATSAN
jgi:hypothetical protein